MIYCCEKNVLHGDPSAIVHLQVSDSHSENSDACSVSQRFCLAKAALWIADFLGVGSVDECTLDVSGVQTVSEEMVVGA